MRRGVGHVKLKLAGNFALQFKYGSRFAPWRPDDGFFNRFGFNLVLGRKPERIVNVFLKLFWILVYGFVGNLDVGA